MPTIFTHAVVPLAIAAAAGGNRISPKLAIAGAGFAILPDFDVIGFRLGIEYAHEWGHRGATHSIVFAIMCAGVVSSIWKEARNLSGFAFLSFAMASHGLLDTFTSGGLGAALWWPFDDARIFAPVTPIRVSPIGMGFLSKRGLVTILSELQWIWLPCAILALSGWAARRTFLSFKQ